MYKINKLGMFLVVAFLAAQGPFFNALADHDKHKEQKHHHEKEVRGETEDDDGDYLVAVNNPTYIENCGPCHLAYPPDLLPSESWNKILNEIDNHFGETIIIDPDSKKVISEYLKMSAADVSSSEVSIKIMKGIKGQPPNRITEIPYIIKKHHEVSLTVIKRPAIGSLSNCAACHKGAGKGNFDDDGVVIPN
ncbi:MAG: cytochrome C [Desulfobacteraceae bacterium]|nr:MAG: cytochrome C [Desulfobacteraceae bacterium]